MTARVRPGDEVVLSRYRLGRRLGTGGFGTVWLARDERLERDVALKMLPLERLHFARFEREARAAARLNHPGIVTLYEASVDDHGGYLVSELVRGHTLGHLLEDGRLSDQDILRIGVALCDALEYAHRRGVVHRDVKPSNVLVPDAPVSSAGMAKLTDFGVARLVGGDSLTRTGDVIGTTAYMAPEQAEGREAQPCADLYSLALVIYEALTGINPLAVTAPGVRGGRLGIHLPALRRHRRDLPRELAGGIDQALRPRPRERGTVLELRAALIASLARVGDEPGIVAAPWPASRRGATDELLQAWTQREADQAEALDDPPVPHRRHDELEFLDRPARISRSSRTLAAGTAAIATAWFATKVLSPPSAVPGVAVLGAALLVAVVPRLGWLALVVAATLVLALQHQPGGALVLALGALPVIILLFAQGERWPHPTLTAALAPIGLAGLWPALAGRGASAWQRAALGLTGWTWLLTGDLLSGRADYVRLPSSIPGARVWMGSLHETVHRLLPALLSGGLAAPAVVWAGGALVLPWVARRPAVSQRVLVLAVWAGTVPLLSAAVLGAEGTGASLIPAQAVVGGVTCLALAGAFHVLWAARNRIGSPDRRAGLA
jgi:serine/threonine protein kinase